MSRRSRTWDRLCVAILLLGASLKSAFGAVPSVYDSSSATTDVNAKQKPSLRENATKSRVVVGRTGHFPFYSVATIRNKPAPVPLLVASLRPEAIANHHSFQGVYSYSLPVTSGVASATSGSHAPLYTGPTCAAEPVGGVKPDCCDSCSSCDSCAGCSSCSSCSTGSCTGGSCTFSSCSTSCLSYSCASCTSCHSSCTCSSCTTGSCSSCTVL